MKISFDYISYNSKPDRDDIKKINKRIAKNIYVINDIYETALRIGGSGNSWCPATFINGRRATETFEQMQLFALDFDGGVSWGDIQERSARYNIPILFAYETFSSVNCNKFRVVFLNDISITDIRTANVIIQALMNIFKECDKSCKDVSRMFFGGKSLIYFNDNLPTFDIDFLIMNMGLYIKQEYGESHYTRNLRTFAKKTGLSYDPKTLLGVSVFYDEIGEIAPNSIIYKSDVGEESPKYYLINFDNNTVRSESHKRKNHNTYRSNMIENIRTQCKLFREFEDGSRWLYHDELVGVGMNLIYVECGISSFVDILNEHVAEYPSYCGKEWLYYLTHFKKKEYLPMSCERFCPYANKCQHGGNMLNTAKVKYCEIVKLNTDDTYCSLEEAEQDLNDHFAIAMNAVDTKIHVIKAQTAIGKTHTYLEYAKKSDRPCLIAVPTNLLKHEVYDRAMALGLNVMKTPSIYEFKDVLPDEIRDTIQYLFDSGRHHMVTPYIAKVAKENNILCLFEYLETKARLKAFNGHIITTHQYLLLQNKDFLDKYHIIIDEDILKTISKNHCCINIGDLEKVIEDDHGLAKCFIDKLKRVVSNTGEGEYFTTTSLSYRGNLDLPIDLPAFFYADKFYSDGQNIHFIKGSQATKSKYVTVSATANEDIYKNYFGSERVVFYNCKQDKYKGRLTQYCNRSMSRRYVKNNDKIYKDIQQKFEGNRIITFKSYLEDALLHFGNTEGCDYLRGQDIVVAGTPHMAEFVYKIFAFSMNLDISDELRYQEIIHNGYRFWLMTYKDEKLRNIQLWMIESELEQAVGRARLLRCDCTVTLFSNFPLPQAELERWKY